MTVDPFILYETMYLTMIPLVTGGRVAVNVADRSAVFTIKSITASDTVVREMIHMNVCTQHWYIHKRLQRTYYNILQPYLCNQDHIQYTVYAYYFVYVDYILARVYNGYIGEN